MSNLMRHAEEELKRAGYSRESEDPMDRNIYLTTMGIVKLFAQNGHSGGSAGMHAWMINQLLQFKPLGPITNDPNEWIEIEESMMGRPGVMQNRRRSDCFSEDGLKTYYSVDEFWRGWRRRLFGREKRYPLAAAGVEAGR